MDWLRDGDHKRLAELERLAVEGTRRTPQAVEGWLTLAQIYRLRGAAADLKTSLDGASAIVRGDADRQTALAQDILALGEVDRALEEVELALASAPANPQARRLKLACLLATKRYARAHAMIEEGERFDPTLPAALAMLRDRGVDARELLARCDEALAARPHHTDALYHKALALARLGRGAEARALVALDEMVAIAALDTPSGYDSGEAFRAALAEEMLRNPTLTADPLYRSTRHGRQVANLLQPDSRAIHALLAQVERAVDAYIAARPGLAAPSRARLLAWGVVLGAEGFQKSHRHPAGWLSGVYYVSAPRPPSANAYPGRLVVGRLDGDLSELSACWGTRDVEPVPGTLVLFPSYVPHGTEPSGIDADRISVAFDVVPVEW